MLKLLQYCNYIIIVMQIKLMLLLPEEHRGQDEPCKTLDVRQVSSLVWL